MDSAITRAWEALLAAMAEAQHLFRSGGATDAIQDLLQHARELLEIIEDEIALNALVLPEAAKRGLVEMRSQRSRLTLLEGSLVTKH